MKASFISGLLAAVAFASEPNPPNWDTSKVLIFSPGDADCQSRVDAVWFEMGYEPCDNGQWSDSRYVLMFKPGSHNCNVNVGYYTQILGLGASPVDTVLANLYCPDSCGIALDNFWRGVENVEMGHGQSSVMWHVSQAAPMRRVNVVGDMELGQGWSSGGYLANSHVTGTIHANSQQQWFTRNVQMDGGFTPGAWNFVFVGCSGNVPPTHCGTDGALPATTSTYSPYIAEKPFINIESDGRYTLNVPWYQTNANGFNWEAADKVDFSQVYVANENDSAATINAKLNEGLHVVCQPGNYYLDEPIKVGFGSLNTQVLLGLGMATLISNNGNSVIEVADGVDARIAGFLIEAGQVKADSLLKWGTDPSKGNESAPGMISDVFSRVGGRNDSNQYQVTAQRMIEINNKYVIIDHTWLWRADHDIGGLVYNSKNYVENGLQVNADYVKAYGLFSEHTLGDLVQWNGNHGEVWFYQSELPYDVTQANYADQGYVGFHVADGVTDFTGHGIAVYTYFRDNTVWMPSSIKAPSTGGVTFENSYNRFLNGYGGIQHVLNDQGSPVGMGYEDSYLCYYSATFSDYREEWEKPGKFLH